MASKVNTKFVVILVGSLLALALGVGALAAYSLRMSGERNVAAGDELVAQAREARAAGNEEQAIEYINDAASQYGRAVNKDRSRRDWLVTWRDTLLQTIPETDIEYQKQFVQRYLGALDRLASLNPSDPVPQLEYLAAQEELRRLSGSADALLNLEEDFERRAQSLGDDSPTKVRLKALQGLARTDRAAREVVDADEREEAVEWMERFYNEFQQDEEAFTTPPSDSADPQAFAESARDDHAQVALGLVRAVINEHRAAQSEGRFQDAQARLNVALETIDTIMNSEEEYADDPRFLSLRTGIRLIRASSEFANPARQRAAQVEIFAEVRDELFSSLRATSPEDLPLDEIGQLAGWYTDPQDRAELIDQIERVLNSPDTDARRLLIAAQILSGLEQEQRALQVFDRIRQMPLPTLSIEGLILPDLRIQALAEQVEVNLSLRRRALQNGATDAAEDYLDAAIAARDALEARSGASTRRYVLLANADIAMAQGETTQAIRLLEEYRREFGDSPDVLADLAQQLLQQGTVGEAKQLLERLVSSGGVNARGVLVLADIYRREGDLDRALRLLESESRRSANPEAFVDSIEGLQTLISIREGSAGADPVLAAIVRTNELIARRDFDAARERIDRLLSQDPSAANDIRVLILQAQIDLFSGDRDAAIARLERALDENPGSSDLERLLAELTAEDRVALRLAEIDASDRPEIDKALQRYELLRSVGRSEEAMAEVDRAEQIEPDHPTILEIRFSNAVSDEDLAAAARIAARAEESNADGVDGLLYQGRLQMARGEQAAAIRTLRTAADLVPSSAQIRRYLGLALLEAGQVDEGLSSLRRAYEARRSNDEVLFEYVTALRQLGRQAEARAVLDPGIDPGAPARTNRLFTNIWLGLEAQVGSASRALEERRTYFRSDVQSNALASSDFAKANAIGLIDLLVNQDELDEAEQVLTQMREHLSNREIAQAEAVIALGRAERIVDPAEAREASLAAIESLREVASAEAERMQEPGPLLDAARFAFGTDRFDLGVEILRDAVSYESAEDRTVSREIARRLGQRAAGLEDEAQLLAAQAEQREESDPLGAEALRERAAQASGRADASREEAAAIYQDLVANGIEDDDATIALSLAEQMLQTDQLDDASEIVQRVRSENPDNLNAMLLGAQIANRKGDQGEATRLYNLAVEKHPTNFLAFYRRALFFSEDTARRADVLADLRRVNELRPSLPDGWILRFQVLMQSGNRNAAFAVLEDGIASAPSIADALSQRLVQELARDGRVNEAFAAAAARANASPNNVYWQFTAGNLAKQRGAMTEAARYFERLLTIPGIVNDPTERGRAAALVLDAKLRAGQTVPAEEVSRLAALIDPLGFEGANGVTLAMLLARAYSNIPAEYERAGQYIQQAYMLASEPGDGASPSQKIRAWFTELPLIVGGSRQAYDYVAGVDQAIRNRKQQNPGEEIPHPLYLRVLALQAAELRDDSPSDLIEPANALLQVAESDPLARYEIHKTLSRLHTNLGDIEAATRQGQEALAINPNDLEMLNNVAFFLAKYLERAEEALPFAKRAVELAPEQADVLDTVGTVYFATGDVNEAISLFERSLRFATTQRQRVPANIHLAEALIAAGDKANAERHLRDAERLLPVVDEGVRNTYTPELARVRELLESE